MICLYREARTVFKTRAGKSFRNYLERKVGNHQDGNKKIWQPMGINKRSMKIQAKIVLGMNLDGMGTGKGTATQ